MELFYLEVSHHPAFEVLNYMNLSVGHACRPQIVNRLGTPVSFSVLILG